MRILLDHSVPRPLKANLPGHDTDTAAERGWQELHNGDLLDRAESDGYDLLITADQQMPFQQNFARRKISVLIITTDSWPDLRQRRDNVNQAVNAEEFDQIRELDVQQAGLLRAYPSRSSG